MRVQRSEPIRTEAKLGNQYVAREKSRARLYLIGFSCPSVRSNWLNRTAQL